MRSASESTLALDRAHELGHLIFAGDRGVLGDPAIDEEDDPVRVRGHPGESDQAATAVAGAPAGAAVAVNTPTPDEKIRKWAEAMIKQYDASKDGTLQKDEWSEMSSNLNIKEADKNNDDLITKEEVIEKLGGYGRGTDSSAPTADSSAGEGGKSGGTSASSASYSSGSSSGRKSYRFLTPTERLPKGLPSWFTLNDRNGDGQVAMNEFASTWSNSKAEEFARYDANNDGIVTAKEGSEQESN